MNFIVEVILFIYLGNGEVYDDLIKKLKLGLKKLFMSN